MNNYNKPFQITENVGNNVFCFDKISNAKLYVPKLIKGDLSDVKIGESIAFREEKNGKITEYKGLKDFVQIKNKNIYIFDNHNHALYFRYKEYLEGNMNRGVELIHIDQHTDMNKLPPLLKGGKGESKTLDSVFKITNYHCNVGNFIQTAIQDGLISKVHQINTEHSIHNSQFTINNYILDIDLDFRSPEMSIQEYDKTIKITRELIQNSRVVTIATSPYFLDQNLAIRILKDLLK
ncbi:MAG TPA: UPF0489 family protein [Candidatus Absconditabacterales bacterium]|nr:UPF0489 family protein [Candidatus Absconditabacterales bacterium]